MSDQEKPEEAQEETAGEPAKEPSAAQQEPEKAEPEPGGISEPAPEAAPAEPAPGDAHVETKPEGQTEGHLEGQPEGQVEGQVEGQPGGQVEGQPEGQTEPVAAEAPAEGGQEEGAKEQEPQKTEGEVAAEHAAPTEGKTVTIAVEEKVLRDEPTGGEEGEEEYEEYYEDFYDEEEEEDQEEAGYPAVEFGKIEILPRAAALPVAGLPAVEVTKPKETTEQVEPTFGDVLNVVLQTGEKKKSITRTSITKGSITKGLKAPSKGSSIKTATSSATKASSTKYVPSQTKASVKEISGIISLDGKRSKREKHSKTKQKEKTIHAGLNLRANYKIIIDGNDVTPKTLHDNTYQGFEEKQLVALDLITGLQSQLVGYSTGLIAGEAPAEGARRISSVLHDPKLKPLSFDMQNTELDTMTTLHYEISTKPEAPAETEEQAPPAFSIPIQPEPTSYPKSFSLILKETETIFILDMQSLTVEKGSFEASQVEADNEAYEYLTEGKGRKRKMTTQDTQTPTIITKNRATLAERSTCRNNETFASEWEMLDTYKALEEASKHVVIRDPLDSISPHMIHHRRLKDDQVENELEREAIQAQQIISKPSFKAALLVIERLLASNVYEECQKKFRGLITSDPCRMDLQFTYRLDLLWTFNNTNTTGRSVSGIRWNKANHDILAVGYGRFFYGDTQTGLVAIWNIKNPTQPEREYNFETPVTSISFSGVNPNLLAIGFYDGDVIVIDISSATKRVVSQSNRFISNTFEPIWQIKWYREDYSDAEFIMCTGQDGRINRYQRTKTTEMIHSQLMRVCRLEGEVQGVYMPRRCVNQDVSISRYPAALVLRRHPTVSEKYFIGTDEGCVYECSINYPNQHLSVIYAHTGPVFAISFSPFCPRIYLTCGGDWHFRLWVETIKQPILSMRTGMDPVQFLSWSPTHSCIIAVAAGNTVQMWDLSRKMFSPSGVTDMETIVTLVKFTESGSNLVVATVDGAVHTYTLEDVPYPPYYQSRLLLSCIKKALIGNPDMIRDIEKLNLGKE